MIFFLSEICNGIADFTMKLNFILNGNFMSMLILSLIRIFPLILYERKTAKKLSKYDYFAKTLMENKTQKNSVSLADEKAFSYIKKQKTKLCPARFLNQPISVLVLLNTAVLVLLKHPRSPFTSPAFSTISDSYSFNSICHKAHNKSNQSNFLFIISTCIPGACKL